MAVLGGAVVASPVAAQDIPTGDDAEVRIVARRLESGRIEFGLQQRQADDSWGSRHLPRVRFFPTTATVGRWLASSSIDLSVGEVRIVARRLESGRIEFGLQQRRADDSWGDRRLPRVRFFPTTARVGRWLASSPLTVTASPTADADSGDTADGRPQQGDGSYRDVRADASYAEAVAVLAEGGVFAGTWCDDGFCPDDPIDRKTMAVWLVRLLDGEYPPRASQPRFDDVDADGLHAPFIERLAVLDSVTGCSAAQFSSGGEGFGEDSVFLPHQGVTRGQAVAFLASFYCFRWAVPDPGFSDVPPTAWYADPWSGADLAHLVDLGAVEGCDGGSRFCPDRGMTRAEMATALWRLEYPEYPQVPPDEQAQQVSLELNAAMDGGGVISGGVYHGCALRYNQTVVCWGGHLDYRRSFPPFRFQSVATGAGAHSCGVRADQTLACWGGLNEFSIVDGPPSGAFTSVAAGFLHSCGLRIEGTIECWFINDLYEDAPETLGEASNYGQVDAPSGSFTAVSAGYKHSCGLRTDHSIACWGDNRRGQATAPSGSFTAVSAGYRHSCGLRTDHSIACWGDNEYGQADAPSGRFTAVSAPHTYSCGVRVDQSIACWGNDYLRDVPSGRFVAVSAGGNPPCAVRVDGTVACWGFTPGGRRDPSNAVWGVPPIATGCTPQPVSGARPGRPAGAQIAVTGAVGTYGHPRPPVFVRWGRPCGGGRVDHYVVQWRRGNGDFGDEHQRTVNATDTADTYSLIVRDPFVYAVRVTAVNSSGRTSSDELIVPSPSSELRTNVELLVTTNQDRYPWLADAWDYMKREQTVIWSVNCPSRYAAFVSCVNGTSRMSIAPYPFSFFGTVLHEMAHIYHTYVFGYTYALSSPDGSPRDFGDAEDVKGNAAAVAAGLLYLFTSFPECQATEMLADMALFPLPQDEFSRASRYVGYWSACSVLKTRTARGLWKTEEFERAPDVAQSVFVDQEIPQWFYDTYQRADGTWDLDALRSALSDADRQLDTGNERGIRAALRTFIPEL